MDRTYYLVAGSEDEMTEWVDTLCKICEFTIAEDDGKCHVCYSSQLLIKTLKILICTFLILMGRNTSYKNARLARLRTFCSGG